MPDDAHGSVTDFFDQLRGGDGEAAEGLWQHFGPRLLGLARKTLADRPKRVTDADDAVQSAFVSFWQRAKKGDFKGDLNRDNLWNLLARITVRKVLKQQERERAQKRGGGRVHGESSAVGLDGESFQIDEALAAIPAQDFDLTCDELLQQLDTLWITVGVPERVTFLFRVTQWAGVVAGECPRGGFPTCTARRLEPSRCVHRHVYVTRLSQLLCACACLLDLQQTTATRWCCPTKRFLQLRKSSPPAVK